jgi:hypothetical protein
MELNLVFGERVVAKGIVLRTGQIEGEDVGLLVPCESILNTVQVFCPHRFSINDALLTLIL